MLYLDSGIRLLYRLAFTAENFNAEQRSRYGRLMPILIFTFYVVTFVLWYLKLINLMTLDAIFGQLPTKYQVKNHTFFCLFLLPKSQNDICKRNSQNSCNMWPTVISFSFNTQVFWTLCFHNSGKFAHFPKFQLFTWTRICQKS